MSTRSVHTTAPGKARLPLATMLMLAWRNLWRHRRRTVVTLVSIAFGFGLAVVMIGFTDGGHNNMIRNAIKLGEGHITVQPRGYLENPANHRYLTDGKALASQIQALDCPAAWSRAFRCRCSRAHPPTRWAPAWKVWPARVMRA